MRAPGRVTSPAAWVSPASVSALVLCDHYGAGAIVPRRGSQPGRGVTPWPESNPMPRLPDALIAVMIHRAPMCSHPSRRAPVLIARLPGRPETVHAPFNAPHPCKHPPPPVHPHRLGPASALPARPSDIPAARPLSLSRLPAIVPSTWAPSPVTVHRPGQPSRSGISTDTDCPSSYCPSRLRAPWGAPLRPFTTTISAAGEDVKRFFRVVGTFSWGRTGGGVTGHRSPVTYHRSPITPVPPWPRLTRLAPLIAAVRRI